MPPGVSEVLLTRRPIPDRCRDDGGKGVDGDVHGGEIPYDDDDVERRERDRVFRNTKILEGLTSNFFVIYRDGTVRTARRGVLGGYVRHLVLGCADRVPGLSSNVVVDGDDDKIYDDPPDGIYEPR